MPLPHIGLVLLFALGPVPQAFASSRCNLVLILVDGLRADHVGSYGYARPTTPRLDARAPRAIVFTGGVARGIWTLPSMASLFTSRQVWDHGLRNQNQAMPSSALTLTRVLREAGLDPGEQEEAVFPVRARQRSPSAC